ncbi:MAG: hypothetical protein PHU88_03700 [candidate division Zixibacteria bacterium]|nr:hypothetical protein [candidate division Zixibacteria bacterium]MDD5426410.1 hypothetical protein [candidate division Zixibacteria bacterium]
MRCHEARRRIEGGEYHNAELIRHIESCPACERLMSAQKYLDNALAETREKNDEPAPPLTFIRTRVEALTAASNRKEVTVMSLIKSYRNVLIPTGIIIVLLVIFTLIPFSYKKVVGYEVVIPVDNKAMASVDLPGLTHALAILGYNANVNYAVSKKDNTTFVTTQGNFAIGDSTINGEITISNLPDKDAAREAGVLFITLTGTDAKPEIKLILRDITGNMYAAIKSKIVKNEKAEIWVTTDDKTDEQISEEILEKLAMQGFRVADVTTSTTPDGDRAVQINLIPVPKDSTGEK